MAASLPDRGREPFLVRLPDITPEDLSMGQLGDLLKHTEAAIKNQVFAEDPDTPDDELMVSVVAIERNSVGLQVRAAHRTAAALLAITEAIRLAALNTLADRAIREIEELQGLAEKIPSPIEFHAGEEVGTLLACIAPGDPARRRRCLVTGETDLYGELLRVGGVQPRATLLLPTGRSVRCTLSADLARRVAPLLYQTIGLHGEATWFADTWEIDTFRATRPLPYQEGSLVDAFAALCELAGPAWDAIPDPDAYLRALREDDAP